MTDSYLKFAIQTRILNLQRLPALLLLTLLGFVLNPGRIWAQVINYNNNITNNTDPNQQQQNNLFNQGRDSSFKANADWKDEQAKIHFNYLNSAVARYPDSSLSFFHRYQFPQSWWGKDLGNANTAVRNEVFTPTVTPGLSLGYNAYDVYKLTLNNLAFYNTTRPYSAFSFMMGSKNEQNVEILHTQNISPNWNIAARLRYRSSQGFYNLQRSNNIGGSLSSNYQSTNQRYYMAAGFVYNRFKQDENGGLNTNNLDSLLHNVGDYSDRQVLDVNMPFRRGSTTNAAVSNTLRDWTFYVQNNYSIGQADTLYNKDSTQATYRFTPRFRFKHQLELHSERHMFRDINGDSLRYATAGLAKILRDSLLTDSIYTAQTWFYVDNKFSLNGFLGKKNELVLIEAGIANRIDRFGTDYVTDRESSSNVSNYLFGEIKKEAFAEGQWEYRAAAKFIFTGEAVGNFDINADVGKDLKKWGQFSAGLRQSLSNAPYSWTVFKTKFYERNYDLNKTSVTQLWGEVNIKRIRLQLGVRNYLLTNYIYYGSDLKVHQQSEAFSLLQLYGRKEFRFGIFALDNEVVWQQPTGGAPVQVPAVLLRHQFRIETNLFRSALKVATGLEVRYHTSYFSDGYTPYFNQFYYQDTEKITNAPECTAFFNFKIKNFRAYVIGGQLQQFFTRSIINAPGYPAQSALFRFGFNWILVN
ncbi:putative beta-barrel porin [Taibaiella chishuiensis]|uniref:Putative beta-barrel porin n=1 Tax=Taibaiella chishuiensis TaxID=1434707 RepID=A0A2P8D1L4_9BACT|nr:putative beta-barrel porin [Taibaiella chishuiensis]